jgi:hypothetical protein
MNDRKWGDVSFVPLVRVFFSFFLLYPTCIQLIFLLVLGTTTNEEWGSNDTSRVVSALVRVFFPFFFYIQLIFFTCFRYYYK